MRLSSASQPKALRRIFAIIRAHNFTKELKRFEYETKFDIKNKRLSNLEILKKIRDCFKNQSQFLLCEISRGDKLSTRVLFFTMNGIEYSLFKYRGARMLKVKKHSIIKWRGLRVFKNDERLIIDKNDFTKKLKHFSYRFRRHKYNLADLGKLLKQFAKSLNYSGEMIKERVKDFVLDAGDGRIYAVSVSFCRSGNKTQKQLEIEYAGYASGFGRLRKGSEKQVISGVVELSQYIYKGFLNMLTPSRERKFEFVKRMSKKV